MSATGSWPLQVALVAAFKASAPIMGLVEGVYDSVPQGVTGKYIVVGEGTETDDSTMGQVGHLCRPHIECWTPDGESGPADSGEAGYKAAMEIANLVTAVIVAGITVTGHDVTLLRNSVDELERKRFGGGEAGPAMRVVVPKFLILLEDTP
jgi:hypothetical protein